MILRTSTQPTPVTLLLSRASSQCGLYGLVGRAADERHAWRQTWTKGATVHSARSSYLCVKRTSPTLALAARLARVPSASLKRRFTSNCSLGFARLFANLHAYINLALLLCKQAATSRRARPTCALHPEHALYWSSEVLRVHPEHPLSVLCEHLRKWPLGHSRLLGVIIPQAQEFVISDSVHRGLVGVLIRGPCLEQSVSLQLCVWYTSCR